MSSVPNSTTTGDGEVTKSDFRVKLVAIAKDEAAYFTQWVHHHLYFGFDSIEIYINRTSDNSSKVLDDICRAYPQVKWDSADWIDMCPEDAKKQIQFIVYNKVWHETKRNDEFTHIFFLDIDEYWVPKDYKSTIRDYMSKFDNDSVVSFEWLNDNGEQPKLASFPKRIEGNLSPLVKTIYPINAPVQELRHHVPLFSKSVNHLLADGVPFKPKPSLIQAVLPELQSLKEAFIYHRAHRSAEEYVSLLLRGRPGDDFPYKSNRYGLPQPDKMFRTIDVSQNEFDSYMESYDKFEIESNYKVHKKTAQNFVEERYKLSLQGVERYAVANYPLMMQIFRGVRLPLIAKAFKTVREKLLTSRQDDFRFIRDLAIDASSQNLDEAIVLMEKARALNPEGPVILAKLEEFKKKKAGATTPPDVR